jgi:hypothetical protein
MVVLPLKMPLSDRIIRGKDKFFDLLTLATENLG